MWTAAAHSLAVEVRSGVGEVDSSVAVVRSHLGGLVAEQVVAAVAAVARRYSRR